MFYRLLFIFKSSFFLDSVCDKLERAGGYFLFCCSDFNNGGYILVFMIGF